MKGIQYFSLGLSFVMSPVGVCAEMGIPGKTHFLAETESDWEAKLAMLLGNADLRKKMGASGREFSLTEYNLETQAEKLAEIIKAVVR